MTVVVSRSRSRVENSEAGRGARRAVEEDPSRERRHRHAVILLRYRNTVKKVCPNGHIAARDWSPYVRVTRCVCSTCSVWAS